MQLFDYHWSTTERLLKIASQLPNDIYHSEIHSGSSSIHKLFFHLIAANHGWRIGLETGRQQVGLEHTGYSDQESIEALLIEEKAAWRTYLSQLNDDQIDSDITLTTLRGQDRSFPVWFILTHLLLHGMQHHSELAQALSNHDHSPGNIDLIFYSGRDQ
jgi:uncharacterized damage-inducible protein DinB